jgi:hypothetical protein
MFKVVVSSIVAIVLLWPIQRATAGPLSGRTITVSYVTIAKITKSGGHVGMAAVRPHIWSGARSVSVRIGADGTPTLIHGPTEPRKIRLSGRTLEINLIFTRGVTLIRVTFDHSFNSCSASVIHGKEAGNSTFEYNGAEIESSRATNIRCSISD